MKASGREIAPARTRLIVGGVQPVASMISDAAAACSEDFSRVVSAWIGPASRGRIGLADRQADEQGGDPVAELEVLARAADAHRDQADQLRRGGLAAALEQAPQAAGARSRGSRR